MRIICDLAGCWKDAWLCLTDKSCDSDAHHSRTKFRGERREGQHWPARSPASCSCTQGRSGAILLKFLAKGATRGAPLPSSSCRARRSHSRPRPALRMAAT